jgi:dipeptidyl aminopeptidase/acylaminoacyl peptidase
MTSQIRPAGRPRTVFTRALLLCVVIALLPMANTTIGAAGSGPVTPNYELASQWTTSKINKAVFDTGVTPHWLEASDRFWYSYDTRDGKRYFLVDPVKKSRTPLFDNAKLAAMLTAATLVPMDAQHLPIKTVKVIKNDTALRLEIELPKEAEVPGMKKAPRPATTTSDKQGGQQDDENDMADASPQQRRGVGGDQGDGDDENSDKQTVFFEYELAGAKLTLLPDFQDPKKPRWASVSADDTAVVFARGHNLFMMDAANYAKARLKPGDDSVVETQITTDGEDHFGYARRLQDEDRRALRKDSKGDTHKMGRRVPAIQVFWSRDSKRFAVVRRDERKVADLFVINALSNPRPTLETYRYAMPGETNIPQPQIEVFDLATRGRVKVKADRFTDQALQIAAAPPTAIGREKDKTEPQWAADGSDKLYFVRSSRDLHKFDLCLADARSGDVKTVIEERLNVYIETKPIRLVNNGQELLWWSERDGWGHYYLYGADGSLKRQVTSGEFVSDDVVSIDDKARTMTMTAVGREPGEDPYYTHAYRVSLDTGAMKLLDPGDAMHSISASDSGKYFVDTSSRVNSAPKSVLVDAAGTPVSDLETTDLSAALEAGFKFPEPFKVKADDGVTDLYGVIYKPFDFDPEKKYPIIAFVYPGPQTESVTKAFSKSQNIALAQFGFIVIEVGNRGGNPNRSKWYHSYGYGNLRDYGLADKKAAIEQLSRRFSYIDIDRVGIWGHSGGGFMTAAAMLVYPDFFKAGFSESGNHENNIYNNTWSEKHHGITEVTAPDGSVKFEYDIEKNSELARNLKGRLMLVTGDIDDNVHPSNTYRLTNALIKANKRFEFFLLPGLRHSFQPAQDYVFWLRADFFCRHLLGKSADSVDMLELNREKEQGGEKRKRTTTSPQ